MTDTQQFVPPRLSAQQYATIVVDPPWREGGGRTGSARTGVDPTAQAWPGYQHVKELPYPTMTLKQIAALPVGDLAADDAHLYVWTINAVIEETYEIVRGWGFKPGQLLTWAKAPMGLGLGGAFVSTTEHVLFARRGRLPAQKRIDTTWWNWKRGRHSAKPEAFLDIVESVSPDPRLEMFSRRNRMGWDVWGNEVDSHVEIPS